VICLLLEAPGADDDRADLAEEELAEEDSQMVKATYAAGEGISQEELELLAEMAQIANRPGGSPIVAWLPGRMDS
jgi:hypothetical protein